jgi:hypothetical protein
MNIKKKTIFHKSFRISTERIVFFKLSHVTKDELNLINCSEIRIHYYLDPRKMFWQASIPMLEMSRYDTWKNLSFHLLQRVLC